MNNEVTNENATSRITLAVVLGVLKKFAAVICIATIVMATAAGLYVRFFTDPTYTASAKFNVVNLQSNNQYIDSSMLAAAAEIATNCVEIADEERVVKEAVDRHNLADLFNLDRADAIAAVSAVVYASKESDDSTAFTVSVITGDQYATYYIIRAIQDVLPDVVEDVYSVSEDSNITTTLKQLDIVESEEEVIRSQRAAWKYAFAAAFVTFVAAYTVCFFIFVNDTKVYDDQTIKSRFTAPVIGVIPEWNAPGEDPKKSKSKKRSKLAGNHRDYTGKLLCADTPFGVTEAFNTLRTNLCYSTADQGCPVFAVTSDFSGAGKSVVSSNIAMSLAMLGKKTLLIECDLRRPELSKVFGVERKDGLSELLSGVIKAEESVISRLNQENLDIVFSGRIPPNPSELLGSDRMTQFLNSSKEKYDIIIIDTPPAFEVSDIGVIIPHITGTIMVARSNYSDINAIKASEELINGVNGRIVGYVVNDVDFKSGAGYYRKGKYGYRGYRKYARYYSSYYSSSSAKQEGSDK